MKLKTKIRSSLSFFIIAFAILSCSREEVTPYQGQSSSRLVLENFDSFHDTYRDLGEISSQEDLLTWAQAKKYTPLLGSSNVSYEAYSYPLLTMLNENGECQVGDKIIWLKEGVMYGFPKDQEMRLAQLKKEADNSFKIGTIKVNNIGVDQNAEMSGAKFLGKNSLDAHYHQYEFNQVTRQYCGGALQNFTGKRKYVHEIFDETIAINPGPVYHSAVYLRLKLEYKKSSWKYADEHRKMIVNINVSVQAYNGSFYTPQQPTFFPINVTYDCSNNVNIRLANTSYVPFGSTTGWEVMMNGSIYHKVLGDVITNEWTDRGRYNDGILW